MSNEQLAISNDSQPRKMKYSGVEWIGNIPAEWSIIKFKYLHKGLNTGEAIGKEYWTEEETDMFFYTAGLVPIRTNYKDFPIWKYTGENDLLMARNGTPYVYFPVSDACYTDHIIRASMKADINRKYVYYSLSQSILSVVANTVSIATWSASLWNEQIIPFPSEKEQQAIADILDRKCTQIDALIANEEQQIAKLKAYKQSVITEAVTKGLDPDVPMKDSGVEWIGEIPYTWSLKATKRLFVIESGATPKSDNPDNFDGDIVWITPADYTTEQVYITDSRRKLTELGLKTCSTSLIPPNSIIFSKRAPIGLVAINHVELCTNQGCLSCISKTNDLIKYYYYVMSIFTDQYNLLGSGTTFKEISLTSFSNFILPCPPVEEQQHIAEYLDQKCEQIDRLIAIKQQKIEKLQQYKKSLIYEYVTGKKEVI